MNITAAILHLIPEAQFMCWENDYARITWNDTNTKPLPSLVDLELAWAAVQAKIAANKYQELRASAYPPAADFADAYYWAQKGNLALMEAYLENCDAVKLLYPK